MNYCMEDPCIDVNMFIYELLFGRIHIGTWIVKLIDQYILKTVYAVMIHIDTSIVAYMDIYICPSKCQNKYWKYINQMFVVSHSQ